MTSVNETDSGQAGAQSPALRPIQGLYVLLAVVAAVGVLVAIAAGLGLSALYGGFLFIFYWAGLSHADPAKFWPALIGALGGIALVWLMTALPAALGAVPGIAVWAGLVLGAIYLLIMNWAAMLVNNAMMLFLTVGGIPAVQDGETLSQIARAVVVAAAYVGALAMVGRRIAASRAQG